eukprot:scaffold253407_cov28-Tisochrysis_lutea.AAC.3
MCVGKALTGGYMTLGATLATRAVADGASGGPAAASPVPLMHGPTFMANPLACAVASASLDLVARGTWRDRVGAINAQLAAELEPCRASPAVADVRTLGAIGVVEMREAVDVPHAQVSRRAAGRIRHTSPARPRPARGGGVRRWPSPQWSSRAPRRPATHLPPGTARTARRVAPTIWEAAIHYASVRDGRGRPPQGHDWHARRRRGRELVGELAWTSGIGQGGRRVRRSAHALFIDLGTPASIIHTRNPSNDIVVRSAASGLLDSPFTASLAT